MTDWHLGFFVVISSRKEKNSGVGPIWPWAKLIVSGWSFLFLDTRVVMDQNYYSSKYKCIVSVVTVAYKCVLISTHKENDYNFGLSWLDLGRKH